MKFRLVAYALIICCLISCIKSNTEKVLEAYNKKDYKKVIELSNLYISRDKNNLKLYELRGLTYFELKDYQNASNDLYKIVSSGSGSLAVLEKASITNIYLDRNDVAVVSFNNLIKYDSLNPMYYYHRAEAYVNLGDTDKAIKDYYKSISIDSLNSSPFNDLGILYQTAGDYEKSIFYFSKAIPLSPNTAELYFNRGVSLVYLKENDNALLDFNKSIALNNRFGISYYNRALLYMFMDKKKECCSDLTKAISLGYTKIDLEVREYCGNNPLNNISK